MEMNGNGRQALQIKHSVKMYFMFVGKS